MCTTRALLAAIDRATALATAAIALISWRPPDTGCAVLGAAIRELLLAARADAEVIGLVWDECAAVTRAQVRAELQAEMRAEVAAAFAAGRALQAGLATAPVIPMRRLAPGERHGGAAPTRPEIRLVRSS